MITILPEPVPVNVVVSASVDFSDLGIQDTHSAVWDWGDESTSSGTVIELDGSGTVSGTHVYDKLGVYTLTCTVTDDDGGNIVIHTSKKNK